VDIQDVAARCTQPGVRVWRAMLPWYSIYLHKTAITPTAMASRPPCTLKPLALLLLVSGTEVVSLAALEDDVDALDSEVVVLAEDDSVVLLLADPELVAAEDSVEAVALAVDEPVADAELAVPVTEAVEADSTPVPVAP